MDCVVLIRCGFLFVVGYLPGSSCCLLHLLFQKQVRHFSMVVEPTFSCVAPKTYRNRFIKFLDKGVFMKEETAEEEEERNQAQKITKKKKK